MSTRDERAWQRYLQTYPELAGNLYRGITERRGLTMECDQLQHTDCDGEDVWLDEANMPVRLTCDCFCHGRRA